MKPEHLDKDILVNEVNLTFEDIALSKVSPSPYDTAWVAFIDNKKDSSQPLFPQALKWIKENQNTDGSWGYQTTDFYQSLIVNTLISAIVLKYWKGSEEQVSKAEEYIATNLEKVGMDKVDGIAFELIFPSLVDLAEQYNLNIPINSKAVAHYRGVKKHKLLKIPLEVIYFKKTTLSYSLEFLEPTYKTIDFEKIRVNQELNGSYCTSPASTAFVLRHSDDTLAEQYLTSLLDSTGGFAPVVYPIDNMESSWSLNYMYDLDVQNHFKDLSPRFVQHLIQNWDNTIGLAWSGMAKIPDLDDTCVAFKALKNYGADITSSAFSFYQKDGHFVGFEGQRDTNPSYLANLIQALEVADDYIERNKHIEDCFTLLDNLFETETIDKWHLSEYYLISRLNFQTKDFRIQEILNKIVSNQNIDGGWGNQKSTPEETCYALLFILNSKSKVSPSLKKKAFDYLTLNKSNVERPLWISKSLYSPFRLNTLLINSTLIHLIENGIN